MASRATLLGQGIGYLVLRNDLDPETSRSTRPLLAHQAIDGLARIHARSRSSARTSAPAMSKAWWSTATCVPGTRRSRSSGCRCRDGSPTTSGPYTANLRPHPPVVQGGPESLQRLRENGALPGAGPVLLAADADARRTAGRRRHRHRHADRNRETDFGQVDNHSSALRTPGRRRAAPSISSPTIRSADTPLVQGQWSGATLTVSSAASDATQLGGTAPGSGAAATVDGDPATALVQQRPRTALWPVAPDRLRHTRSRVACCT